VRNASPRRPARGGPRVPFDAVLFDLDGTLVDTAPDIADALNAALRDHGLPPVAEGWVRNRIGNGTRELIAQVLRGKQEGVLAESLLDSFHTHYAAHCGRRGHLYPDAGTTLTTLRNAGIRLALLTNKEARFAEFVLRVHGLDGAFDARACGDTLSVKKPDAAVARHCLKTLGVTAKRALLVGDSAIDVETARNAGIRAWAVSYGYNGGRPIAEADPDRIIASLSELLPPLAARVAELAPDYSPRASSSSLYLRSNPRN
jgi:phosphoglycolate phosphatase